MAAKKTAAKTKTKTTKGAAPKVSRKPAKKTKKT
jgi:hypothetical protein